MQHNICFHEFYLWYFMKSDKNCKIFDQKKLLKNFDKVTSDAFIDMGMKFADLITIIEAKYKNFATNIKDDKLVCDQVEFIASSIDLLISKHYNEMLIDLEKIIKPIDKKLESIEFISSAVNDITEQEISEEGYL